MQGQADPAFQRVAQVFADLLAQGEVGGVCLRLDGRTVVNLWGGPGWRADSLACIFSVTKGVLSILAHRLIDRGLIAPDDPVARHWPAFSAQGKGAITVMDVLTHRAGLPAVSGAVARGDLYDWDRMTGHLAASAPVVPPQRAPVYHNMTYGHLLGEILCRATGVRPLGALLAAELTGPLVGDLVLGLSPADQARVVPVRQDDLAALFRALDAEPGSLFARSMAFFGRGEDFNSARWRGACIGSGSGHATAEGIARVYEALLSGDRLSPERRRAARQRMAESAGADPILGVPLRYAQGFELSRPPGIDLGPGVATVGHWGAGGATGFADADAGLAFGYVTAQMAPGMGSSDRARALIAAAYASLQGDRDDRRSGRWPPAL